ncbi:hypothetical protein B0H12DRAFT_1239759 [Mycena haematopus]|nr:hypothetical protein B0H12DRAFT_1239759 [Mycena haematopus]
MPPHSWEAEALQHVRAMTLYVAAHARSSIVLAEDTTLRDTMLDQPKDDPLARHNFQPGPGEDEMRLLRNWDDALRHEAQNFREHFLQLHYAASASMSYSKLILAPAIQKYGPNFHAFYQTALVVSIEESLRTIMPTPPPINETPRATSTAKPPPSADLPNIDADAAAALLSSPDALFGLRFYQRDEELSGYWHIVSVSTKKTASDSYTVFEVDFGYGVLELRTEEMTATLLASCIVPP